MDNVYSTHEWAEARASVLQRDRHRCTVSRLLGGACTGSLHVHHIVPLHAGGAPYELDNLATACAAHHPIWEALRRVVVERMTEGPPRCPHVHRTAEARRQCEAALARARGIELVS